MARVVRYGGYLLLVAGWLWCTVEAAPVLAEKSGYEGLIAPAPPDTSSSAPATDNNKPLENQGIIFAPAENSGLKNQTTPPELLGKIDAKTADDLRLLAIVHGGQNDADKASDEALENSKIRDLVASVPATRPRIDGMLPMEYAIKQTIE